MLYHGFGHVIFSPAYQNNYHSPVLRTATCQLSTDASPCCGWKSVQPFISAHVFMCTSWPKRKAKPGTYINHRMVDWKGLERPSSSHSLPWAGCPPPDQAAQGPILSQVQLPCSQTAAEEVRLAVNVLVLFALAGCYQVSFR